MEPQDSAPSRHLESADSASGDRPKGDPWHAFSYLVSGVLFYGGLGLLADWWLDTRFFVVIGIFLGAGLGIYMTFARFSDKQSALVERPDMTPADNLGKPDQENK